MESETIIPMKKIEYKGKIKEIPERNPELNLCEKYLIAKMRYCKFEKYRGTEYCVYHFEDEETVVPCPLDPSHKVLKKRLKKHLKHCNRQQFLDKQQNSPWFSLNINTNTNNSEMIKDANVSNTLRWDDLSEEEYKATILKIVDVYELLRKRYLNYVSEKLNDNNEITEIGNYKVSGIEFSEDDLKSTDQINKSLKNTQQTEKITEILKKSALLNEKAVFVEFGAGKGGLSSAVNQALDNKCINILLEREGVRFKQDKISDTMIRTYLTSRFNLDVKEGEEEGKMKFEENELLSIIGIAKHICGCALDLSLKCLLNYKNKDEVKAICLATCCHHRSELSYLNNLSLFKDELNLSLKEIVLIIKATSWLFGPISIPQTNTTNNNDNNIENNNNINTNTLSDEIFKSLNLQKNYIGLISKYIIDLARCFYLIENGFNTYYIKYIDNKITTENNLILAIKN